MSFQLITRCLFYLLLFNKNGRARAEMENSIDMVEKGRTQYQLLQEKSNLPRYGSCWRSAVEHLQQTCRHLSEDTQSDIALHITNCFLEMSGHPTYSCESDRKPNLRAICINTMSDRAFNVYTEFYTHAQNMCWFLQSQVWQDRLSESTLKVGRQLETSARKQEHLLRAQRDSLEIQERMLEQGRFVGRVMEDLYVASIAHKELLRGLQSWIVGEISWFNSLLFYFFMSLALLIATSTEYTRTSRFFLLFLLLINFVIERAVCSIWIAYNSLLEAYNLYGMIDYCIWCCRYIFISLCLFILILRAYYYKDYVKENNKLLDRITSQNNVILDILNSVCKKLGHKTDPDTITLIDELKFVNESPVNATLVKNNLDRSLPNVNSKVNSLICNVTPIVTRNSSVTNGSFVDAKAGGDVDSKTPDRNEGGVGRERSVTPGGRYNLRTRLNTPEVIYRFD